MSEESKTVQSRREFVKTATKVAVTAPAAAMLLNASVKPAKAAEPYAGPGTSQTPGPGDDSSIQPTDIPNDDFTDAPFDGFQNVFVPGDDFVP